MARNAFNAIISAFAFTVAALGLGYAQTAAPQGGSVPIANRHGVEYGPVFENNAKIGYAMLVYNAGRLVHAENWGLFDAPLGVIQAAGKISRAPVGEKESQNASGGPVITLVAQDATNRYYNATYSNGDYVFYSVNKTTGQVTIIRTGNNSVPEEGCNC
ncbi:MAG TPA: hypothetical protein DDZ68_01035 [Parvularcula sp.]|nr:hypothetical protein [Parvularcula sp.]HBS32437.1 hypothetical protein [Parvularcula sp.]HBS34148.1 hypothetical protein [Parvularcula sp.]